MRASVHFALIALGGTQYANRLGHDEALGDQALAQKVGDPLAVLQAGLVAGDILDVLRVANYQLEVTFQHCVYRLP